MWLLVLNIIVLLVVVFVLVSFNKKRKATEEELIELKKTFNDFTKTQHTLNKEVTKRVDHILQDHNYLKQDEKF